MGQARSADRRNHTTSVVRSAIQPRKQTRNLTNQATLPAKKTVDKACWRCRSLGERALAITSGGRRADRASSVETSLRSTLPSLCAKPRPPAAK